MILEVSFFCRLQVIKNRLAQGRLIALRTRGIFLPFKILYELFILSRKWRESKAFHDREILQNPVEYLTRYRCINFLLQPLSYSLANAPRWKINQSLEHLIIISPICTKILHQSTILLLFIMPASYNNKPRSYSIVFASLKCHKSFRLFLAHPFMIYALSAPLTSCLKDRIAYSCMQHIMK